MLRIAHICFPFSFRWLKEGWKNTVYIAFPKENNYFSSCQGSFFHLTLPQDSQYWRHPRDMAIKMVPIPVLWSLMRMQMRGRRTTFNGLTNVPIVDLAISLLEVVAGASTASSPARFTSRSATVKTPTHWPVYKGGHFIMGTKDFDFNKFNKKNILWFSYVH